jgi:hypothetical protein
MFVDEPETLRFERRNLVKDDPGRPQKGWLAASAGAV